MEEKSYGSAASAEDEKPIDISEVLEEMVGMNASDLHITANTHPCFRIDGDLVPQYQYPELTPRMCQDLAYSIASEEQVKMFEEEKELDMSFGLEGISRFRVNIFWQRGTVAAAIRTIPHQILDYDTLGVPKAVRDTSEKPRGLVLVCGPTGSGKSTTLASLIDDINKKRKDHIVTVEDPIEYVHSNKGCIINQREVGHDTLSFQQALRRVLRQDPDVILIGEMRDMETIEMALTAAETGHLVFATLHTNDCAQTINRMIDVFPQAQQEQVRTQISFVLECVCVQQLVPTIKGFGGKSGRCLAVEVMVVTPAIRALIRDSKVEQIPGAIQTGGQYGMITMNQSLGDLIRRKKISMDEALTRSSDTDDLMRILKLQESQQQQAAGARRPPIRR